MTIPISRDCQSARVPEEEGVALVVGKPRDEIKHFGALLGQAVHLDGAVGPGRASAPARSIGRSAAATGVDGGVARDPQEPGVDSAVASTEAAVVGERPLERHRGEVERLLVVRGLPAQVSVDTEPVRLVHRRE